MQPLFADPTAPSLPLHIVPSDGLAEFLANQPEPIRAWLEQSRFKAALGDIRLIPGAAGVAGAVAGFGTPQARARLRFGLAKGIAALPLGIWRIEGDLTQSQRDEAALGWLLAQYSFSRYRSTPPEAMPQLVAPKGCDVAALQAMAAGEYLTRDLINTPAADMGPA